MLTWEINTISFEKRVLINNLVAEATENSVQKDEMRENCFARTGYLLHYSTSEADELIKPQGVRSKIFIPNSYAEET